MASQGIYGVSGWRLVLGVPLVLVLALWFGSEVARADVLDQSQTTAVSAVEITGPNSPFSASQTFTAGLTGLLDRVDLLLRKSSSPTSGLTVQIRNVSGGEPGSSVLASTDVPAASVTTYGSWVEVDFVSPALVSSGTQYAIVAYTAAFAYLWEDAQTDAYSGGGLWYSFASPPTSWNEFSGDDLAFDTYVEGAPSISTSARPAVAVLGSVIADRAMVSGGFSPSGSVTFRLYDNPAASGTPLFSDTEPLVGGVATSKGYGPTATGTDYWVATYNGDSSNASVSSGDGAEPVTMLSPASTAVSVPFSSENPSLVGQSVTFTVTVLPVPDGGTVRFTDPGITIPGCGAVPVNPLTGQARCTTTFTGRGRYPVQALYSGDGFFSGSQSPAIIQAVLRRASTLRLSSSLNPVLVDRQVTYTARLSPAPHGGGVTFWQDNHPIAGCVEVPITPTGKATCPWSYAWPRARTIQAHYTGTRKYAPATSIPLTETVNP